MGSCNRSFIEIHNVQSQEISNKVEKIGDLLNMLFLHSMPVKVRRVCFWSQKLACWNFRDLFKKLMQDM